MSVRREYRLLIDTDVVFSGSYRSVMAAYSALLNALQVLEVSSDHVLSVAFQPVVKEGFYGS